MSSNGASATTVSVVIVTYRQGAEVRATLDALDRELGDDDELIVVDNASGDGTADVVASAAPRARLIRSEHNSGFPAACNLGAADARGTLLVFLNPDAVPAPGWRDAIVAPLGGEWAAWQALVTADEGKLVNTRGGVVHFTGIAWAGGAGEGIDDETDPTPQPGFVSGACLAIPRDTFERLGGFAGEFFLYHEDVDLSLRVRLAGGSLGVATDARVDHDYDFDKGPAKWQYLERNRWATLIRTYPGALLALLAPALLASELALLGAAIAGGWAAQKLRAWSATLAALPRLLRERREIQAARTVSAGEFARGLTPALDSAYLGAAGRSGVLAGLLRGYWSLVLRLLRGA